ETPDDGHRDVDGGLRRAAALVEPLDQIEATLRGAIPLEVGDGLRTAGGDERGQLLSDDTLAERRVVPGERLLEAAGLDVSQELERDLRVEGLGREALGDDPVDRDPVLAALSAMGAHELCANARGQALELSLEPRAVQELVERLRPGARVGGR